MFSNLGFSFYKIFMGAQGLDHSSDIIDHLHKLRGLCRGDPGKLKTAGFNPHILDQVFKQGKFSAGIVITFQVMAFAGMSPGHPDTIRALPESGQNELGAHPTGAGDPNHPDMGRIFHSADARKIGSAVTAPVA